jgi:uncharacterized protein (TIGR00251 family)
VRLAVRVIPNARRTEFSGRRDGEIVLRLSAPAVEGKANRAAVEFLAKHFGIPRSRVTLVKGENTRHKVFELAGVEQIRDDILDRPTQVPETGEF